MSMPQKTPRRVLKIVLLLTIFGLPAWSGRADDSATKKQLTYPGKPLRDGVLRLAQLHESAASEEPNSLKHQVGICEAYTMYWCFGFAPRDEVLPKIETAAHRAISLDEQSAAAHTALGIVKLSQRDWAGADTALSRAVELDPNRAQSQHWLALFLAAMGRHEEALLHSERAVALDNSPGMQTGLGSILYFGRDWPRMIKELNATTKEHPTFAYAYDWLGMAYVQEERFAESIDTYKRAVELSDGLAEIVAGLGHAYGLGGKRAEAREVLETLLQQDERWYVPPVQIAYVYVGLGEYEQAIKMLQRADKEHSWELVFLREEPWFDPIRSDPRFIKLHESMQFPNQPSP